MRAAVIVGLGLAAALVAGPVHAANGNKARVAPVFWGQQCVTVVDRAVDPVFELDIAIPFEDADLTADELPDSRTWQFFALGEDRPAQVAMPNWVRWDDAERAVAQGLMEEMPADADVLEGNTAWADAIAMHDAAQRVPITCEATAGPVAWDTTGVAAGNYVIRGHTFEPVANLWTARMGLVRVVDGGEDPGPYVGFSGPTIGATASMRPGWTVRGCAGGAAGTQVELSWAAAAALEAGDADAWQPFATVDASGGELEATFTPPSEAEYAAVFFRAVATDPQGRTYTSYTQREVVILPGCDSPSSGQPATIPDACGVVVQPEAQAEAPEPDCGEGGSGGEGDESGGAGESGGDDGGAQASGGDGGGCSVGLRPHHASAGPLLGLLALARIRRRPTGSRHPRNP